MKKYLILILFLGVVFTYSEIQKVPFDKWPQIKTKSVRVLIAKGSFAHQGFAGAESADFKNTFIYFPDIKKGTEFINYDQGYGPVIKTLAVIFMDKKWKVLKISIMKKETGTAIAPLKTFSVFECVPSLAQKLKFKLGSISPIKVPISLLSE